MHHPSCKTYKRERVNKYFVNNVFSFTNRIEFMDTLWSIKKRLNIYLFQWKCIFIKCNWKQGWEYYVLKINGIRIAMNGIVSYLGNV